MQHIRTLAEMNIAMKEHFLPEQLHVWYLQATEHLGDKERNPHAQKNYHQLTDNQQSIDRFIADRIIEIERAERVAIIERLEAILKSAFNVENEYGPEVVGTYHIEELIEELKGA